MKDIRNELEELKKEVDSGALQLPAAERSRRPLVPIAAAAGLGLLALGISIYAVFFRGVEAEDAWELRPLTTFQGMEENPTWNPDGSLIAYDKPGPEGNDIYVIAASGGPPERLTRSPPYNALPRWSPTGEHIAYVSDRGAGLAICLIPQRGGDPREIVRTTDWARGAPLGAMPWSPDGKQLLFMRDDVLWRVDIGTLEESPFADAGVGVGGASWSPDGRWITFERWQDERPGLWVIAAKGGEPRPLVVDEHANAQPAWSADGRRLVFQSVHKGYPHLWEVEVSTRRLRQLTSGPVNDYSPTVARDGRVAFMQSREGADLYICRVADGGQRQVTFHRGGSYDPRFSPDGKKLLCVSNRSGEYQLWMRDLATDSERQLTFGPEECQGGDWSPDGRRIVFLSDRDGGLRLWLVNVDGGAPRQLMDRTVSLALPRWSPDGRAVSFLLEEHVWAVDPEHGNPKQLLTSVLRLGHQQEWFQFDWYLDSRRAVYSRRAEDGSGEPEMVVRELESGREVVLFRGVHAETIVAPDGRGVAFCRGAEFQQELCILRLRPPDSPDGLPEPIGEPQQLTDGKGAWHVHNGGWSPDSEEIVYTHAAPEGEILVIENYR